MRRLLSIVLVPIFMVSAAGAELTTSPFPNTDILVTHDFDDGQFGSYSFDPTWAPRMAIIADPTDGTHGKVLSIHYQRALDDDNKAIFPDAVHNFSLHMGEEIWFQGDFFLPSGVNMDPATNNRKFLYWSKYDSFPEFSAFVFGAFGSLICIANGSTGPSTGPSTNYLPAIPLTAGVWHHLEIQLRLNSNYAARDGILRIWLDGSSLWDRTDMTWTDPQWTEDPSTFRWASWGVGYQDQQNFPYDEYRYWDNVTYARTRPASLTPVSTGNNISVTVFPNPWRSDRHAGTTITFGQLASDTEIKIFNASGHLVKTLPVSSTSVGWDLANDSGKKVASGVYFYVATDGQGNRTRGKLAIIK